jgi:hypothetical protein
MIARAQRFPIRAVMHYRIIGENRWYVGSVENMSSTGVLFRGEQVVHVNSSIEVAVNMSRNVADERGSKLVSLGNVVRVSPADSGLGSAVMAAALSRLRILRY